MRKLDLEDLERKTRAATPGPWSTEKPPKENGWQLGVVIGATMAGRVYAQPPGGQMPLADLEYIAAIGPDVALALIARIRELDEALNDALAYTIPGEERDRLVRVLAKGAVIP